MNHPVSPGLRKALDMLTTSERRILLHLAKDYEEDSTMGIVLDGLACQILAEQIADKAHEDAVLHQLAADRRAEVEAIDRRVNGEPPAVEGVPMMHNPETGEWSPIQNGGMV